MGAGRVDEKKTGTSIGTEISLFLSVEVNAQLSWETVIAYIVAPVVQPEYFS